MDPLLEDVLSNLSVLSRGRPIHIAHPFFALRFRCAGLVIGAKVTPSIARNNMSNAIQERHKAATRRGVKRAQRTRIVAELQQVVAADAIAIVRSIIAQAKAGDIESRRAFLKLLPQGKWPTPFAQPTIDGPHDIPLAIDAVLDAASRGDLAVDDAEKVIGIINAMRLAYETTSLADQIEAMREQLEDLKANSS